MKKTKKLFFTCTLFFVCLFLIDSANADKKFRIHFIAASFSYAKDEAENSKLAAFSSRAGYDAVWEASVPDGFPNSFGSVKQVSGSGLTQIRNKPGIDDCDGELFVINQDSFPGVSVYNIDGDKYALSIQAPHASGLGNNQPLCSLPLFVTHAEGEGVTSTPPYSGLPNFPGTSSPPSNSTVAAFVVDAKRPDTTVNFSYVQTASFPQLKYNSKSVWFGYVTVESDPSKQLPGAIDPLKLFNYVPPDSFQPPSDPPSGGSTGGGGGEISKKDIITFIKDPVIKQIVDALQTLQQIWNTISQSQARSLNRALYVDPAAAFTYDPATRQLTINSVNNNTGAGSAAFKIAIGKSGAKSAGKNISIQTGTQSITLTLPTALVSALNSGKKVGVEVIASFGLTADKKLKASVSKSFSLKKRG